MKGILHPRNDITINPSGNPSIRDLIGEVTTSRRQFLGVAASSAALASFGGLSGMLVPSIANAVPIAPLNGFGGIGFESIIFALDKDSAAVIYFDYSQDAPEGVVKNLVKILESITPVK